MYSSITKIEHINLDGLLRIAMKAGEAIMDIYHQPFEVTAKQDGSPLTLADQKSNKMITDYLIDHYAIPILSEENESVSYEIRKDWKQLWIIDPLDGTKEFINKRREFTVNIALVQNGRPILGIIYAPVFRELYYAVQGDGAYFVYQNEKIRLKTQPALNFKDKTFQSINRPHLKVILSRSHNDNFSIENYIKQKDFTIQTLAMGSSLKFCRIAHGIVDMNIRMKPTSEWDTAAAQIILEEAGRNLVKYEDGTPLDYNKESILNPYLVAY